MDDSVNNNDDRLYYINKRFKLKKIGRIAKAYSKEVQICIYKAISKIICLRYGNFVTEDEIYQALNMKGNIYSIDFFNKTKLGVMERENLDVGVDQIIGKITPTLLHELIHRIGYVKNNESFDNMFSLYREAGTEIVTAECLKTGCGYDFILDSTWGKFTDAHESYFLISAITNQLNTLVGSNLLEKSILKGENYFEPAIEKTFGMEFSKNIKQKLLDIKYKEDKLWQNFEKGKLEDSDVLELKTEISDFQNEILTNYFDSRFSKISSKESGREFLEKLKEFSFERIHFSGEDNIPKDIFFEKYFLDKKAELEKRFSVKYDVEFRQEEWSEVLGIRNKVYTPKEDLSKLADEFERKHRKKGFFEKIFERMKQKQAEKNNIKLLDEKIDNPNGAAEDVEINLAGGSANIKQKSNNSGRVETKKPKEDDEINR